MILALAFSALMSVDGAEPDMVVEKEIVYQKETVVDLSGSTVEGQKQAPPAFFLSKTQAPEVKGLLSERLHFSFRDYNLLGF